MAQKKKPPKATTKRGKVVAKAKPVKVAKPAAKVAGLNDKQKRFCEEYIVDLNGTHAYQRAFPGVTENSARAAAARLLASVSAQAYVAELQAKRSQRTEITQDRVLKELAAMAFIDITDAFEVDGRLKKLTDIPENVRRAISGIEVSEITVEGFKIGETKKIKVIEKTKSLELIGRHLKMFTDKVEHGIPADDPLMKLLATIAESKNSRITA